MSKTIYLECSRGISGDMFAAALLDLGADPEILRKQLDSLSIEGADIKISRVKKAGLDVCDFDVVLDQVHENHDHDMHYLYGSHGGGSEKQAKACEPEGAGGGADSHNESGFEHDHGQNHEYSHEHRGLTEILEILRRGSLSEGAAALAEKIFRILAGAEAKAHGVPEEQVHFHEVGAVDSILDIAAAAVCMDNLGITHVIIPQINEGRGAVRCRHGVLPVPVPAVVNIAADYGLPLHIMEEEGEFVTPTGAAIAAAIRTGGKLPERFTVKRIGMGAGKRAYEKPGILRAFLIEEETEVESDRICKLESNIDDCTGEALGFVMERLLQAGARDVHYTPVYMKKNRPAYQLDVICNPSDVPAMEQIIFQETTTIGIRRMEMERSVLNRSAGMVKTVWGEVRVKICRLPEGVRCYPEYEDVASICRDHGIAYPDVYQAVLRECGDCYGGL